MSFVFNNAKKLVVTLKDKNGQVLASKNIKIILNDKSYQKSTDSYGQVVISPNLNPGSYVVDVYFEGDYNYNYAYSKSKITVKKATPKLTAKTVTFKVKTKTKKYTVTLKTNKNKIMKNIKLYLKVNKKTYTAKTNSKGKATFKIKKLTKGTYKTTITFKGSSNYNKVTTTIKIKCK